MWTERHSKKADTGKHADIPLVDERHFQRDRARIIHSASFRSLQSKTQVLGLGESDFYRTRLTHSLEVAQIGSGICEQLKNNPGIESEYKAWIPSFSLIEAICLAHDIGHPPFGHGGEIATNYMMRNHGGFEANGQTLRILTRIGEYSENDGLDLSRRTLLGTIKYPAFYDELKAPKLCPAMTTASTSNLEQWQPPKCLFREEEAIVDWILLPFTHADIARLRSFTASANGHATTQYKSLDTSVMELADDIAYGVHDLEDAIALKLLDRYQWQESIEAFLPGVESSPLKDDFTFYTDKLFSDTNKGRKHAISKLVGYFINRISIACDTGFSHPLLGLQARMEPSAYETLQFLKHLVMQKVILRPELQALQFKGQQVIVKLFDAFADTPDRLLPTEIADIYREQGRSRRVICDYVASMTDLSAGRLYHKLYSPNTGSIFDRV